MGGMASHERTLHYSCNGNQHLPAVDGVFLGEDPLLSWAFFLAANRMYSVLISNILREGRMRRGRGKGLTVG